MNTDKPIKNFFPGTQESGDAVDVATYNPYQPLTREELFNSLEELRKRAEEGHVMDALAASANVRGKYGL